MSKHTPGRLQLFKVGDHLEFICPGTEDGESILAITHEGNTAFAVVWSDMNARRLVACWNACEGIDTYALDLMTGDLSIKNQITATGKARTKPTHRAVEYRRQRDELLAALDEYEKAFAELDPSSKASRHRMRMAMINARAVIAKVKGGAA